MKISFDDAKIGICASDASAVASLLSQAARTVSSAYGSLDGKVKARIGNLSGVSSSLNSLAGTARGVNSLADRARDAGNDVARRLMRSLDASILRGGNLNLNKSKKRLSKEYVIGGSFGKVKVDVNAVHVYDDMMNSFNTKTMPQEWYLEMEKQLSKSGINLELYGITTEEERERFLAYLYNASGYMVADADLQTIVGYASVFSSRDKSNGYHMLYQTPILVSNNSSGVDIGGHVYKGGYLKYFNIDGVDVVAPLDEIDYDTGFTLNSLNNDDYINFVTRYYVGIMDETNNLYGAHFRDVTSSHIDRLVIGNFENLGSSDSAVGLASQNGDENSYVYIDLGYSYDENPTTYQRQHHFDYLLGTYTHELGHVYANASSTTIDIDSQDDWISVYNQLCEQKSWGELNSSFINPFGENREYPYTLRMNRNPEDRGAEMFAEAVRVYYSDPDALRSVFVEVPDNTGTTTVDGVQTVTIGNVRKISLYDYMSEILEEPKDYNYSPTDASWDQYNKPLYRMDSPFVD